MVAWSFSVISFQKYRYQDEDTPPQEHSSPHIANEVTGPELVHVSEKNLSQIENVHGFVSHSHISPVKVGIFKVKSELFWYAPQELNFWGQKNVCETPLSVFYVTAHL